MKKRFFCSVIALILSLLLLTGCGEKATLNSLKKYLLPQQVANVLSGTITENDNLKLDWDYERQCILVSDKKSGAVWSTMPYDFYKSGETASGYKADGICSFLKLTYLDAENQTENEVNSNSDAPYVNVEQSKTGIRVTYYFDKIGISVPVTFILEEDNLSVSVENALIKEDKNKIISVSLLPFFVSAPNDNESYLFVPSGSGALIYTDDKHRGQRKYSEQVYGNDLAGQTIYEITETQSIRMPVFGAKSKDKAICAIITEGAETADISAIAGDNQLNFSGVYPTFKLRGSASSLVKGSANTNNDITKYSEDVVSLKKCTVKYYLLPENKSDYNGMAECYRNYLSANGSLSEQEKSANAIVTILGGLKERKLFLGLPYHTISSVTTLPEAQEILSDLIKETNSDLAVNLKGFGSSGLDYGETAGGFAPNKAFGGKKALDKLNKWSKDKNIDLFYDFDMVLQTESYGEFRVRDSAVSANDVRARFCEYNIVTREQSETAFAYLTNRLSLAKSSGIIDKKIKNLGLSGVALSTLTSSAYSDYSDPNYYCKAHMSDDVVRILDYLKKKNLSTLGNEANSYAAAKLDYVYNAPTKSSKYYALDMEIPFYQMVFRGSTVLSGEPINLSSEPRAAFLETMATGSALSFSLCNNYSDIIFKSSHSAVALSVYEGIKDDVTEFINSAKPLQESLGKAKLVSYTKVNQLAKSVFDNGVTVYVNFGDKAAETDLGTVDAKNFIFG